MTHWQARSAIDVQTLDDGLTLFSTLDPVSRRGKRYYCYLLPTPRGNVMIHAPDSPSFYRAHAATIDALGGVRFLFLTHDGDDSDQTDAVLKRWDAKLLVHRADLGRMNRTPGHSLGDGFEGDHDVADGVSIVHLPGHSAGYSGLLRRQGGVTQFFGGHLLTEGPLGWRAARAYTLYDTARESLSRLKDIEFDMLMPDHVWLDTRTRALPPIRLDAAARRAVIDEALDHLKPYKPRPSPAKFRLRAAQ